MSDTLYYIAHGVREGTRWLLDGVDMGPASELLQVPDDGKIHSVRMVFPGDDIGTTSSNNPPGDAP